MYNQIVGQPRTLRKFSACLKFAHRLNNQRTFLVYTLLGSNMFNPIPPARAEKIKPKTVVFFINLSDEPFAEYGPLRWSNDAFKNRKLDPLSIIFTYLRNPSKSTRAPFRRSCNIITHQNKHPQPLLPEKRGIPIQLPTQTARQKQRLTVGQKPHLHFLPQKRMHYLLSLPLLIGGQDRLPGLDIH